MQTFYITVYALLTIRLSFLRYTSLSQQHGSLNLFINQQGTTLYDRIGRRDSCPGVTDLYPTKLLQPKCGAILPAAGSWVSVILTITGSSDNHRLQHLTFPRLQSDKAKLRRRKHVRRGTDAVRASTDGGDGRAKRRSAALGMLCIAPNLYSINNYLKKKVSKQLTRFKTYSPTSKIKLP